VRKTRATSHAYLGHREEQFLRAKNLKAHPGRSPSYSTRPYAAGVCKGKDGEMLLTHVKRWRDSVSNARCGRPARLAREMRLALADGGAAPGHAEVGVLEKTAKRLCRLGAQQAEVVKSEFRTRAGRGRIGRFSGCALVGSCECEKKSREPELPPRTGSWRCGPRARLSIWQVHARLR
jgi:hypothetical protein